MGLFGNKNELEGIGVQLSVHPMLKIIEDGLRSSEGKEGYEWMNNVADYYDDGRRTVAVLQDYFIVANGPQFKLFPKAETGKEPEEIEKVMIRYSDFGYEPISNYKGIGYKKMLGVWIEQIKLLMSTKLHPEYSYSSCQDYETGWKGGSGTYTSDMSQAYIFTYTLPRPPYKKWLE